MTNSIFTFRNFLAFFFFWIFPIYSWLNLRMWNPWIWKNNCRFPVNVKWMISFILFGNTGSKQVSLQIRKLKARVSDFCLEGLSPRSSHGCLFTQVSVQKSPPSRHGPLTIRALANPSLLFNFTFFIALLSTENVCVWLECHLSPH